MKNLSHYTIVLRPDTNGTFIAREELDHVFDMIRDEYLEEGRSLPQDVDLVVSHAC